MTSLPKRPRTHVLETKSKAYFISSMPSEWIHRNVSLDYGLDLNIEIVERGKVTGNNFSVQLKSTDRSLLRTKTPFVRLKCSTLNYMLSRPEPVMIVYYSSLDKDALWIWSHEIHKSCAEEQRVITIPFVINQRMNTIDWDTISKTVKSYFSSRPIVDQTTASKLERFGRYRIDLSRSPYLFREEVDYLEEMINARPFIESNFQRFIEAHPETFLGGEYLRLHAQIRLKSVEKMLIPDFLIESVTGLCDILELKGPVVIDRRARRTRELSVQKSIVRVRRYAEYFEDINQRNWVQREYGLNVFRPQTILLAGRDREFKDVFEKRRLESQMGNFRILTYDDLLRMARARQIG